MNVHRSLVILFVTVAVWHSYRGKDITVGTLGLHMSQVTCCMLPVSCQNMHPAFQYTVLVIL